MRLGKRAQDRISVASHVRLNVAVIMLFVILSVPGGLFVRDVLLRNASESNTALARYLASEANGSLMMYRSLLEFGVASLESRANNGASWQELEEWSTLYNNRLRSVLGDDSLNAYAVVDGKLLPESGLTEEECLDVLESRWYEDAVNEPDTTVFSDVYEDCHTGNLVVTVAQYSSEADALLAFDLYPEYFSFQVSNLRLSPGTSLFLCDSSGADLFHVSSMSNQDGLAAYLEGLVEGIDAGKFAEYDSSVVDPASLTCAVSYSRLSNGWLSIVTTPYSEILGDLAIVTTVFAFIVASFVTVSMVMTLREWRRSREMKRIDDTVRALGNSYYAIYLVDCAHGTYDMIKGSKYARSRVAVRGDYPALLDVLCEVIEDDAREDFRNHFSLGNISSLVALRVHDYGGDFLRKFGDDYRWVNVRVLFDATVFSREAILCFREVDEEKRRQLQERNYLEQALESARSSLESKQAFFNNMSHDMRTPLNAIIGLTDLAAREEGVSNKMRRYLNRIGTSGRQLLALINDILDMSQMERGAVSLSPERMRLSTCARDCAEPFEIEALERGKKMKVSVDVADDWVMGDPVRLGQILNNLLSNALKYTRAGDSVSLSVAQARGRSGDFGSYVITVSDTGIGMSPDYLEHIFDPYSREKRFGTAKALGTGLGMPITKSLVEQMGGTICVESKLDQGTTIVVTLPFAPATEAGPSETTEDHPPLESLAGMRVMVAEDNEVNMEIASEMLEAAGVEVRPAWNGKEALEVYRASDPYYFDAILMDMKMPVMDGCVASCAIRDLDRPDAATVPIIAVTANAFAEDVVATAMAGMDAHVAKPIDFTALFALLVEMRGRSRAGCGDDEGGKGEER